jgi:hypothetical protein
MAFKLDDELLEELGLAALPPHDKQAILRQILETLEMRVGTTLASRMSDAQLDEFERLMPAEGDDQTVVQQKEQQALRWLETNFPNYKQVVNDELEKLKVEIRQSAPQILATSQQNNLPTPNLPASQMPPMPVQQPSQMAAQPLNYGQAPVTPPYVPAPQQDMQMPLTPQPGFTTPPAQYPTQPPTNPTTMQPQPYMPPPADNNSQPPYPSQQQPY